jgi:hypothetical protein
VSECTLISSLEYQPKPAISSKAPKKLKEETFHCLSLEDAFFEILTKENPNIVAIGETHPNENDKGNRKTTLKLFAHEILPFLVKQGYKDLVLEELMSDPEADQAAAQYFQGKKIFEDLANVYFYPSHSYNFNGLKNLFEVAKDLKIQIFGGGFCPEDPEMYFDMSNLFLGLDSKYINARIKKISQRTRQKIIKLLQQGKTKIISYNGALHNDIFNSYKIKDLTFGEFFKAKTKYKYVEVDLLSPEQMEKGPHVPVYVYPEYERWLKSAVPKEGVNLIKRGNSSYTLIFPAGTIDR